MHDCVFVCVYVCVCVCALQTCHNKLCFCTDSCNSSDLSTGNKCYSKTRFSGHPGSRTDWYHGQTNCSLIEGDIAYSYLDDQSAINNVKSYVDRTAECVQLWLGVAKRQWLWPTGNVLCLMFCIT